MVKNTKQNSVAMFEIHISWKCLHSLFILAQKVMESSLPGLEKEILDSTVPWSV